MGRPKGSKNKAKVSAEVRTPQAAHAIEKRESVLDTPSNQRMGQTERAIREDAAGQDILAKVERVKEHQKVKAAMQEQGVHRPGDPIEARFLRPGDKLLALLLTGNRVVVQPEHQEIVTVSILIEGGRELVLLHGVGEVRHKLYPDAKCEIERKG